jgi:hypothetical protein
MTDASTVARDRRAAPWRRFAVLLWLLPCTVLAVSGVLKLAIPAGTPPRLLDSLLSVASWDAWQRVVGLGELLLAALAAWPATRRPALAAIAALLAAFSLLVAASAADLAFVGDCGCFGGLGAESRYYGWLVLRNAVLVFAAIAGALPATRERPAPDRPVVGRPARGRHDWRRLRIAALATLLLVLLAGVIGEVQLRVAAYRQVAALATADRLQGYQGRPLPSLALTDPSGASLPAAQAFAAGDVLAFVSRDCPHCLSLAPALAALHDSLVTDGRRVVMVLVNASTVPDAWRERMDWQGRPAVATLDRPGLLRLGVDAVPRLLQLGPDREVQFNEAEPLPTSLWKSLALVDTRVPGLADHVWQQLAAAVFGDGCRLATPLRRHGDVLAAAVRDPQGRPRGHLCVVQDGWRHADIVELAVGISGTRIVGVVPLSAGAYARVFTPALAMCDSLRGRELADAERWLAARAGSDPLSRPVLRSLRRTLARIEPISP